MNIQKKLIKISFLLVLIPLVSIGLLLLFFSQKNIQYPFYNDLKSMAQEEIELKILVENDYLDNQVFDEKLNMNNFIYYSQVSILNSNNKILYTTEQTKSNQINEIVHSNIYELPLERIAGEKLKLILTPRDSFIQTQFKNNIMLILLILSFGLGVNLSLIFYIKMLSKNIIKPLKIIDESFDKLHVGNYSLNLPKFKVNEINKMANRLQELSNELKENSNQHYKYEQSRKKLIAKITHDLKTPLTSIKGYIEALQDNINNDEETYFRYLEIIHRKANKLNFLIEDLLLFSQLDLENFTYDKKRIDSKQFLENYTFNKALEFKDKKINFILEKPFIATNIYIDPKRIIQVLENIITNAEKFTHDYIAIRTELDVSHLIIMIEDNGVGISPKHQPHIFELFYKADQSRSQISETGSGIGLNISKQIIEAHNGKINLESIPYEKTVFKVFIPLML